MKVDTNIAFGEETVVLDSRAQPQFKAVEEKVTLSKATLTFPPTGGEEEITVTATGSYDRSKVPAGYSLEDTESGVKITAEPNEEKTDRTGKIIFTLREDKSKKATLTLTTSKSV